MATILCIVDSYEWALANRARSLEKHFKNHSFVIKHFNDLSKINFNKFDIVYSLNWPIHGYIHSKIKHNRRYRLVTTVSSHIGRGKAGTMKKLFEQYDAISTSSKLLYREFKPVYKNKVFNTPFGVEEDFFIPKTKPSSCYYKFGWVGNKTRRVKRYNEILSVFSEIGYPPAKLLTAGGGYSREEMVDFYNEVGTVLCFSDSEGTPNPMLEAASCGRSIISTSVGNVPELIKKSKTIKVVKNKHDLKRAIIRNINKPDILNSEGEFLRGEIIKNWSWKKRSKLFLPLLGIKHV
jgi:glycosyltransferase involved in cell wall biosynthesis